MPFEELNSTFMLFGGSTAAERAEILPSPFRILFTRIQPILPGLQFADHGRLPWSSFIELPAGIQVVKVQNRVEHHEIAANGLSPIDGVIGEEHDMSFPNRNVDHHR